MEAAIFGMGFLVGLPFGAVVFVVLVIRGLIHASDVGDTPAEADGSPADRR